MEEVDLVFLKKSREFLEQHVRQSPGKPFFLFHSAQAVHLPSFAAPQFKGSLEHRLPRLSGCEVVRCHGSCLRRGDAHDPEGPGDDKDEVRLSRSESRQDFRFARNATNVAETLDEFCHGSTK